MTEKQQLNYLDQQDQQPSKSNKNYFSLLCRNGPLPQKYHQKTDLICLLTFTILIIGLITLCILNGVNIKSINYQNEEEKKLDVLFCMKYFLWQIVLTSLGILAVSMILAILTLYIPSLMAFFSIIALYIICILFTIFQLRKLLINKQFYLMNLFKALTSVIFIIVTTFILLRRKIRLKNLGLFLKIPSIIIKSHLCKIFTHMIVLSLLQIFCWYGFVNLYYGVSTSQKNNSKILKFITRALVIICWFWTSGAFIAFSDYFVTSFTVHWFYHLSKQEQLELNSNLKSIYHQKNIQYQNFNQAQQYQQQISQVSHNKYESLVLFPIYQKLFKQIGTIIFGSILAYMPLYLISKVQKVIFKSSSKFIKIASLSKYGYLDTIMQWQSFATANQRIYNLRHRIKSIMPQLYMLGHMYGDFTKIALILIAFAGFHQIVDIKSDISHHKQYFIPYLVILIIFAIGLCTQIITNFTNLIGKCGDVAFFLYCIDLQIQRVHYSNNQNYSSPKSLIMILRQLAIKRTWKQDK